MHIPILIALCGVLLFIVALRLYFINKKDKQSAKIYSLICYIGFTIWFGFLLYIVYNYAVSSFGLIDLLIVFCCFAISAVLILQPAWGNKKKKILGLILPILGIAILVPIKFLFLPINGTSDFLDLSEDSSGFQVAYDNSYAIKQFAETSFEEKMGGQEYEIINTAYGFVVSDEFYYVVGFQYEHEKQIGQYGYKIFIDEQGTYRIIEESSAVASFIYS